MFDFSAGWISLKDRTLIQVTGSDALHFLQGQLTFDLLTLGPDNFGWAAHCSPKGKVLFTTLVVKTGETFLLDAPMGMSELILSRLRPFILRSKVRIEEAHPHFSALGLMGQDLEEVAKSAGLNPLPAVGRQDEQSGVRRLRLSPDRLLIIAPPQRLAELSVPLDLSSQFWELGNVREGIAEVIPLTTDRYIPQWLNWDRIGGISFRKGCYTGQEIVARTHYLGKVKRRALHIALDSAVSVGTSILHGGEVTGEVFSCIKNEQGKYEGLAIIAGEESSNLVTEEATPQALRILPLPYALSD
ncbi:glycine cleavage T protein (aminomethyl transferase) [mine drainage metagenome]|uniref:Glycine cleavage T protein (Aminomethyl transferase) n=1 Tax=mine drainage metagenome TaxID=410659 RepID=T0ZJN2_9ZZZZ